MEQEDYDGAQAIKDAIMVNIDGIIAAMKPHLKPEEMETQKLQVYSV